MDRYEAQYRFWSQFLPAYDENSVPTGENRPKYPYLTFECLTAPFDGDVLVSASIWTRSTSWETADKKADEIYNALKNGGAVVPYDGGIIWFTAETPFAQRMGDPGDDLIKRQVLQVVAHFA